jgi:RND superfamily putative drug exporter
MYRSLARWCFRHGALVLVVWIAALVATNAIAAAIGPTFDDGLETPSSESSDGIALVEDAFGAATGAFGGSLVFRSEDGILDPAVAGPAGEMVAAVDAIDGVVVTDPFTAPAELGLISPDGTTALARVNFESSVTPGSGTEIGRQITALVPDVDGLQVEIGGSVLAEFEPPSSELIGLAFAVVILIVAFGSVLAMGLPIGVALAGVGTGGLGAVSLMSHVTTIPETATFIGIMIGLGVGIDYALFIVTRYRELTREGVEPIDAIATALHTAGRAVVFAGVTVVLSLLGMLLVGLRFVSGFGLAAAVTVTLTVLASITLLPALIGLTHRRIEVTRWRGLVAAGFVALSLLGLGLKLPAMAVAGALGALVTLVVGSAIPLLRRRVPLRRPPSPRDTLSYRWSRVIQARPVLFLILGAGLLLIATLPVFGLRFGFSDDGNFPPESTTRKAYDLVAESFGPGANGPILVVATADTDAAADAIAALPAALATDPGVAEVAGPYAAPPDPDAPADAAAGTATFLIEVEPTTAPQDATTDETVLRLRDEVIPPVVGDSGAVTYVTGSVPIQIDFSSYLSGRLIVFLAAVLGVSFLVLAMVFRSLLVPLKAVIMNVLSIAAAYGVVVAIFQWGWLSSVFGVEPAPIEPFVPIMLFAIVFGLSMDYEVFLLSRIREEFGRTGDATTSVADGLAATARVITAAAAIMVVVFGAFLLEDDRVVKLFGVGLAVAVLLDATVVRMVLVPATMQLLGSRNWWLPHWLDRLLPRIDVEGHGGDGGSSASAGDDGDPPHPGVDGGDGDRQPAVTATT